MKLPSLAFIAATAVVPCSTITVILAQESIIQSEARQFGERAIAKGYQCRTEVHQTTGKAFE